MYLPKDPLRRFIDIFEVLNAERGWFSDASSLRFAAMAAITCEGAPGSVARTLRAIADELKERSGWFGELTGSLRFIVAAMLLQNDDRPADFMAEVDRVRNMFREAGVRRGGSYEVMAALILRGPHKSPVVDQTVARFQAIYEEMKTHHWWITGVADFPACAILVGQPGTPESLGQEIEAIYQELHAVGFKKGDPLQTSANLLYLAHEKPASSPWPRDFAVPANGSGRVSTTNWRSSRCSSNPRCISWNKSSESRKPFARCGRAPTGRWLSIWPPASRSWNSCNRPSRRRASPMPKPCWICRPSSTRSRRP
jgi:hypothetical protein